MEIYLGPTDPILDKTSHKLHIARIVTANAIFVGGILLNGIMYGQRRKNKTSFNSLYGNLVFAACFFTLVLRPGTIIQSQPRYTFTSLYCTMYTFMTEVEATAVPTMVIMLAIERVFYLNDRCKLVDKKTYTEKMSAIPKFMMIMVPWLIGFLLGIIKTFGLLTSITTMSANDSSVEDTRNIYTYFAEMRIAEPKRPERVHHCVLEVRSETTKTIADVIFYTFRSGFPVFMMLAVSYFYFSVWRIYFYLYHPQKCSSTKKENNHTNATINNQEPGPVLISHERWSQAEFHDLNMNQAEMGLPRQGSFVGRCENPDDDDAYELPTKPTGSLITTTLLNFMMLCITIAGTYYAKTQGCLNGNTQWLLFILESTAVCLPYFTFPEVRSLFLCKLWLCERKTSSTSKSSDPVICKSVTPLKDNPAIVVMSPEEVEALNKKETCSMENPDCSTSLMLQNEEVEGEPTPDQAAS